jgi:hypothetical protein
VRKEGGEAVRGWCWDAFVGEVGSVLLENWSGEGWGFHIWIGRGCG